MGAKALNKERNRYFHFRSVSKKYWVTLISAFSLVLITIASFTLININSAPKIRDLSMQNRTFAPIPSETPRKKNSKPSFIETSGLSDKSVCKIPDQRIVKTQPQNVGFPISPDIIPIKGNANIIVMAVDFPDAVGTQNEDKYLDDQLKKISDWYSYFSGNQLTFEFQRHEGWIRAPFPSGDYLVEATTPNSENTDYETIRSMAQGIVNASGNLFDFSKSQGMLFLFPPSIQGIERDLGGRGVDLQTPQGQKNLFFWGGGKYQYEDSNGYLTAEEKREDLWSYWIHEMLHSQGFSLHSPGNGIQTGLGNNQYGDSYSLDRWQSFLAGWIQDNDVYCQSIDTLTSEKVKISPVETGTPGKQLAVVRLNDSEALVIESRRATGYSAQWPKGLNGLLVYRINTTLDNDRSQECCGDRGNDPKYTKWGYYLAPEGNKVDTSRGPLLQHLKLVARENDVVTYGGVKIELVYTGDQDYVEISKVAN
jgi:hypothetical protein